MPSTTQTSPAPGSAQVRIEQHPAILDEAQRITAETLVGGFSPANLIALTERAVSLSNELTITLAAGEQAACRAGCAWCCRTTVVATSPLEILRIAAYLRAHLGLEELTTLRKRLAQREQRITSLPEERQDRARLACALLVKERCSIYDVRPLACRGFISSDAAACEASYRAGWTRPIPNGPRHLGIAIGVRDGVRRGLESTGHPARNVDLTRALGIALDLSDADERWLAGEPIFASAEI